MRSENSRYAIWKFEQSLYRCIAALDVKISHLDQCRFDWQTRFGERVSVALETLLGGSKIFWTTDATDSPVIPAYQMQSRLTTAITIVYNDGIAGHSFEFPVQRYHRDLMLQKGLHSRAIGARGHKNDPVDALLRQKRQISALFRRVFVGIAKHDVIT